MKLPTIYEQHNFLGLVFQLLFRRNTSLAFVHWPYALSPLPPSVWCTPIPCPLLTVKTPPPLFSQHTHWAASTSRLFWGLRRQILNGKCILILFWEMWATHSFLFATFLSMKCLHTLHFCYAFTLKGFQIWNLSPSVRGCRGGGGICCGKMQWWVIIRNHVSTKYSSNFKHGNEWSWSSIKHFSSN